MENDDTLISRAQTGDEDAFTELMRTNYAFVYAIVIGIVNNPSDAEEVVQDTFLNAYRALTQYEERTKLKSWLAKIARNRALNWLREQRMDTVSIDKVDEQTDQMSESPDEQLIRREQRVLIRRAMESLPQKDRDIAHSYYLDGASYDELIRAHGLSYKAISFRLSRAKQKLAKRLGHLLTGVFVSPITSLKHIYSGGLTVMKVGTVPKITAGVVAIIVLAYIGTRQFISSKEDSSPSIEIVASTPTEAETSLTQTDTVRKSAVIAPLPEDKPQISEEEMGQIEDFFAQLEDTGAQSEADTSRLPTDAASNQDSETGNTDPSVASASTILSAEEVMEAYVEAMRTLDSDSMLGLMTVDLRETLTSVPPFPAGQVKIGEIPKHLQGEIPADLLKDVLESELKAVEQQTFGRIEIVGHEYIGDEFRFRLRIQAPDISGILDIMAPEMAKAEIEKMEMPALPDTLVKMRKEDGTWRIYGMGIE